VARNLAVRKISLDTHALYWFLEDPDKLSPAAQKVLYPRPEFIISIIVLFELLYMEKKSGGSISSMKVLKKPQSYKHTLVSVDKKVFHRAKTIKEDLDLHDRIIAATALLTKTSLITKDEELIKSKAVKTIW
jgi:PIN domain nuclease of toxin-antitoxin system